MRKLFTLTLIVVFLHPVWAQKVDSVRLFLDSALNIMQHKSIYTDRVNWKAVRDSAHLLASNATNYIETKDAVLYAFNKLGDKHGWITIQDSSYYNPYIVRQPPRINKQTEAILLKGPVLYNGIVGNHYAYISIHFFGSQDIDNINNYAQRIQDSLCKNINSETRGIIIDLRLNGGGNTFPMLVGVSNILGEGKYGYSLDGKGRIVGENLMGHEEIVLPLKNNDVWDIRLKHSCGDLSKLPVAIIIGPATGSAAEQVAIAFSSRKNTVLIGERTAGYVTANDGYDLNGFGGIVLAVGYTMNNKGQKFIEDVKPDIEVIGGDNYINRDKDKKYRAAIKWLEKH